MLRREGAAADRYVRWRVLGEGGAGRVWLAEDRLRPGTLVALKEMPADCPVLPRHEEAFRREFAALASLRHPSVVEAREFDIDLRGAPRFTLELIAHAQRH